MSLYNSCFLPTTIPNCDSDAVEECELVKIAGVVNQTNVKTLDGAEPTVLYCYRLEVENCSGGTLCNAQMSLALRWKANTGGGFDSSILTALNAGAGLQNTATAQPNNEGVFNIMSNIPDAVPITVDGGWNGQTLTKLFESKFSLPPGRFVVTVCFEVLKSALPHAGCPLPALFPALADLVSSAPKNSGCPVTVSTIVGCSPTGLCVPPIVLAPPIVVN